MCFVFTEFAHFLLIGLTLEKHNLNFSVQALPLPFHLPQLGQNILI
jgi:hypothetical protein